MRNIQLLITITMLAGLLLSACRPRATHTPGPQQTQTFQAGLTQTARSQPTASRTLTSTPSPTGTLTPSATNTKIVNNCNDLAFIKDMSIPDNTV